MKIRRRQFLGGLGTGLLSGLAMGAPIPKTWRPLSRRKAVTVQNSARNVIFILLEGGPSHVDTFDLKLDLNSPNFLGATNLGGYQWPAGTMPKLAARADKFSILRSINAVEAVHERAIYHLSTAHRQNAALVGEIPHFSSVLSYKFASQRNSSDTLPTAMKVGDRSTGAGFLGAAHNALSLDGSGGVRNLNHVFDGANQRLALLDATLDRWAPSRTDLRSDHLGNLREARQMMEDEELITLLGGDEQGDEEFEPKAEFLRQCATAVRVIEANKGTRVFQMQLGGWDHHIDIYNPNDPYSLAGLSGALDEGFAYLLDELAAKPASSGNGTLLDETLVIAMGEFGRTVDGLNTSNGRDHYPDVAPAILAGGGVKGGRAIGASNANGSYITDRGWSRSRLMGINDLVATLYSALGVDWSERFEDTPSGRVFEMVDTVSGPAFEIDSLFN